MSSAHIDGVRYPPSIQMRTDDSIDASTTTLGRNDAADLRLVATDDPHRIELRTAAVRVAEGLPGLELDLVVAGPAPHLLRGLAEAHHARCADRVRRQHAARRVPRDVTVGRGRARFGELPAVAVG